MIVGVDAGANTGVDAGANTGVDTGAVIGIVGGAIIGVDAGVIIGVEAGVIMDGGRITGGIDMPGGMEVGRGGMELGSGGGIIGNGGALNAGHDAVSTCTLQSRGNPYAFVWFTEGLAFSPVITWHRQAGLIVFTLRIPSQHTWPGAAVGPDTYVKHGVKELNAIEQSSCALAPATKSAIASTAAMHILEAITIGEFLALPGQSQLRYRVKSFTPETKQI